MPNSIIEERRKELKISRKTKLNFCDDLLRETIRKNGFSQRKLAPLLGMTDKTFSKKMNGYFDWKLSEIQQLQTILKDLDVNLIFNIKKV